MDITPTVVIAAIKAVIHIIPRAQPPQLPPLSQLYKESYDSFFGTANPVPQFNTTVKEVPDYVEAEGVREIPVTKPSSTSSTVSTACMNCARSHLATVAGAWEEALRFARTGGIGDPEVVKRLSIAEKELNIMERVDLSPASIEASPREQQDLARKFLPAFRDLRQKAGEIASVAELEKAAADAENTGRQLRLDLLKSKGVDVNKIADLVKKVEAKEITVDQAKAQLHNMVPRDIVRG